MLVKTIKALLYLIIVAASIIAIFTAFGGNFTQLYNRFFPCRSSIVYTIGTFDTQFGISKEDFLQDIKEAEAIWEKPLGKDLFTLDQDTNTGSDLKINLLYDYRQEATDKINTINQAQSGTKASYDALKNKYALMQKEYAALKIQYQAKVNAYQAKQDAHNKKVDYWNSRGGAPKAEYDQLAAESASLKTELAGIRAMEEELNSDVNAINAMVSQINALAKELNLNVEISNGINQARGEEFTEGQYHTSAAGQEIDVYEFSTKERLVRVLAHELGHALGLDHVADPNAIMYYLNQNKTGALTADDLEAIKTKCGIK